MIELYIHKLIPAWFARNLGSVWVLNFCPHLPRSLHPHPPTKKSWLHTWFLYICCRWGVFSLQYLFFDDSGWGKDICSGHFGIRIFGVQKANFFGSRNIVEEIGCLFEYLENVEKLSSAGEKLKYSLLPVSAMPQPPDPVQLPPRGVVQPGPPPPPIDAPGYDQQPHYQWSSIDNRLWSTAALSMKFYWQQVMINSRIINEDSIDNRLRSTAALSMKFYRQQQTVNMCRFFVVKQNYS